MKSRSIGLSVITADLVAGHELHHQLLEVAKAIPHTKFGYFSVYSNEMEDDVEVVAEGAEDVAAVDQVRETLRLLGHTLEAANAIINAIHRDGIIFREVER